MLISADVIGEIKSCDGGTRKVMKYTLKNENIETCLTTYGASITSLKVLDKHGESNDIVMGFDHLSDYLCHRYYFGCTVGRVANRIAKGEFTLNNIKYSLVTNNGPHHLHGGTKGFDKVVWDSTVQENGVTFSYISPSMDENYPGEVKSNVTYELRKDELVIDYNASTSEATPINMTNHSYFNLAGHGSGTIHDHIISLNADHYIPVDETLIPKGIICPVVSTNFDFREPKAFGTLLEELPEGFDHTFCINGNSGEERKVARVYHSKSGRCMEVHSTQPGVQLYTANFLPTDNSLKGKEGKCYNKQGAFCLETQNYPDAINQVNFPRSYIDVGEVYSHTTRFSFSIQ